MMLDTLRQCDFSDRRWYALRGGHRIGYVSERHDGFRRRNVYAVSWGSEEDFANLARVAEVYAPFTFIGVPQADIEALLDGPGHYVFKAGVDPAMKGVEDFTAYALIKDGETIETFVGRLANSNQIQVLKETWPFALAGKYRPKGPGGVYG